MSKASSMRASIVLMMILISFCLASSCIAQTCKGKDSWPELMGVDGQVAAKIIRRENPLVVEAIVLPEGTMVITDYRCDRVWVFVSKTNGTVVQTPGIG